jgi:cytochrome c556
MKLSKTTWIAAMLVAALGAAGIATADSNHGKAIDYRSSLMGIYKWNMGNMGDMMKGKTPFDQAAFAGFAKDLATATQLNLMVGFPEGSDEGDDTDALPDIWLNWEDFVKKYEDLGAASAKLAEVAKSGDKQAIGAQMGEVGKACKACHKNYKD